MDRKNFLKYIGLISAGSLLIPAQLKAFSNGPFYSLRNKTGYFVARGGTIGWYVDDDVILAVDSQFQDTAAQFVQGIFEKGSGPEKILFNTHHHGDHVGGNGVLREAGFTIIAHENVPELQHQVAQNQGGGTPVTADKTFSEKHSISLKNETVTAQYYGSAHTSGDSVIWFEQANIAHMGDLVFNHIYPFIDVNGGANIQGWISLLEKVMNQANKETIFIHGHTNPQYQITGGIKDLENMHNYLSFLLEYVSKGLAEGKSADELASISQFEAFPNHISFGERLSLRANVLAAYGELVSD